MKKLALLAPLALALVVASCSGGGSGSSSASGGTLGGSVVGGKSENRPQASDQTARATPPRSQSASAVPEVGPQIVQIASLRISVAHGRFDESVAAARNVADALGGFVASSSATQGGDQRLVKGTLVLRIPAESYGDAMERLRGLGKLEALDESGRDVSQDFVDLHARVRQLEAVEAQLLRLLHRARSVPAALSVQSQLSQVQLDLEQARGRLNYLNDRVSYATITLTLHELGAVPPKSNGGGGFGIVDAWAKAGAWFLAVVGAMFVGIAVAAPVLVALALAFFVGRLVRRRFAQV